MKTTIGIKIGFAFFALLLLFGVIGTNIYYSVNDGMITLEQIKEEARKQIRVGNLRFKVTQVLMASNDYVITNKDIYKQIYQKQNALLDKDYHNFIQSNLTDKEKQLAYVIRIDIDSIRIYSERIFSITNPRQSSYAWELMEIMDYSFGNAINDKTTLIFDGVSERIEENRTKAEMAKQKIITLVQRAILISLIFSLIIIYFSIVNIARPIKKITKAANFIAKGDYTKRLEIKTHDEIASLADSFNQMSESIHRSQKALEDSKRFVESIIEAEPECVCVISQDGTLQSINPAGLRIINADTPEQVLGKTVDQLVVPEHLQSFQNLSKRVFMGEAGTLQFEIVGMKGKRRWLETNSVPLCDEAGHIIGNLGINRDITERKLAEEELHKVSTAIDQTADWVVITDRDGIIQYTNPAFTKISGYSREEAIGKTPRILKSGLHPPPLKFYETLWETIIGGEIFSATFTNKNKDGKLIFQEETITPIKDKEGNITHFVSTGKEITERILANKALKESEERMHVALKNSPIVVYNQDMELRYTWIYNPNPAFTVEQILGKTDFEILTPEDAAKVTVIKQQVLETGVSTRQEIQFTIEGGEFYFDLSIEPLHDDNGKIIGITCAAIEINEHKLAEQEIISQKNRFAQLFENSPIAIALLDTQDKIISINESFSALFGFYVEEIRGKFINDLIVSLEFKEEAETYSEETRGGGQISKESYRKKKDGTIVYVQIVGIPVTVNDKTVGIYGMYVDLTHRKDAEEKMKMAKELAEQSDRLKSEFLAQMSHEVRTPLNAVLNYSSLIKSEFEDKLTEEYLEVFDGLEHEGKRITRTIDSILNLSQLHTGTFVHQIASVNLGSDFLPTLIKVYSLVAKAKNLDLRFRNLSEDSTIFADQYCVEQIFSNLVDNAIKFTDKGFVEIRVLKDASNVIVEVEDSGIGISNDFIPQLFEPFRQEEHGYSRKYEGNGLGLTLTKRFCELNNASIEVESKKNNGSIFRVKFNV